MYIYSEIRELPVIAPRPRVLADRREHERRGPSRPPIAGAGEQDRRAAHERRASPRVEVELDFEEHVDGSRFFRMTRDLSIFGLSTRGGYSHELGARFGLKLFLPDDARAPLHLQAEVVGCNEEDGGMRLAFRSPSAEAVRRIHRYLVSRLKEAAA